jgi:hypothetical protein
VSLRMSYSYDFNFDHSKKLLYYTMSGEVDFDNLISITHALYADPEYYPDIDVIIDVRECDLLLGFNEMSQFVQWLGTRENRIRGYVAFVAGAPSTYGTTRMYGGLGDELQGEINYFASIEAAEKWLEDMKNN